MHEKDKFLYWKNIAKYKELIIFLSTSWNKVLNAGVVAFTHAHFLSAGSKRSRRS